jgi:CheY-like chemotaxis protein
MGQKISVLVVEDEVLIRMDMVDFLRREGFEVFEAAHSAAAIEILERTPSIAIIFTDFDMPGTMDGLALAAAVRDRWPPVKIVVTSGHRTLEPTDLPDGGLFFSKPYRHDEIAAAFRELASDADAGRAQ